MDRIDAHQHFWRFDPVRNSWITPEMAVLRRDFLPDDAAPLLAAAGIDGVVAVQADQSPAETQFLLDLAARHPIIRGVVGWIDLRAEDLAQQLTRFRGLPALKGFRHIAQAETDDFHRHREIVRGISTLGDHGYSYDILIYPRQLAAAEQLVARCPGGRFVLDHCAKPAITTGEMVEWRAGMESLARHPNVYCKISGLVTEATWYGWTDADIFPYLDAVAAVFGVERLIFASDFPVSLLSASYADVVALATRWAGQFTAHERDLLFGGTATAVYHLEN